PFHFINIYFGKLLDTLLVFSIEGLEWLANLPFAVICGIEWSLPLVILGLMFVVSFTISLARKSKEAILASTFLLGAIGTILCVQFIGRINYSGVKVYNVRAELAL